MIDDNDMLAPSPALKLRFRRKRIVNGLNVFDDRWVWDISGAEPTVGKDYPVPLMKMHQFFKCEESVCGMLYGDAVLG